MKSLPNNYTQLHSVIYVFLFVALYGDKKKSLDEIDAIKKLIKDWDNSGNVEAVYKETKDWFEQDKETGNRKNSFQLCVDYLNESLDRFHKPGLIEDLLTISKADGEITDGENLLIKEISEKLGCEFNDSKNGSTSNQQPKSSQQSESAGFNVILQSGGANKLAVVKLLKEIMNTDMMECKDMVDNVPFTLKKGIDQTTADYIKISIEEVGGEIIIIPNSSSNDSSLYTVIFKKPGADKLQMVMLLMDIMKLGLKDAKDIVDNPPSTIVEGVDKSNADFTKNLIEKIGGECKIVPMPRVRDKKPGHSIEKEIDYSNVCLDELDITNEQKINSICEKIRKDRILPHLLYVNQALDAKGFQTDNHKAHFFVSDVMISDQKLQGFLYVNMDGFYSNCMIENEMQMLFAWGGVNNIELTSTGSGASIDLIADKGRLTISCEDNKSLKILDTLYHSVWKDINKKFAKQSIIIWNEIDSIGIKRVSFNSPIEFESL